ncbi:hypothetical protein BGZ63DRAFT_112638 [Mariannaea sp. PMI_226]|nr:hypothetical protein BGZ63DRAFT_112638 [Mariannaea sp. PMI_226]
MIRADTPLVGSTVCSWVFVAKQSRSFRCGSASPVLTNSPRGHIPQPTTTSNLDTVRTCLSSPQVRALAEFCTFDPTPVWGNGRGPPQTGDCQPVCWMSVASLSYSARVTHRPSQSRHGRCDTPGEGLSKLTQVPRRKEEILALASSDQTSLNSARV